MEEDNNVVKFQGDNGEEFEMAILKEFDHNEKKYAVLMDMEYNEEEEDLKCEEKCECEEDCGCEGALYIVEITSDKDGNEIFVAVEDEKLYDELIEKADKLLFDEK